LGDNIRFKALGVLVMAVNVSWQGTDEEYKEFWPLVRMRRVRMTGD